MRTLALSCVVLTVLASLALAQGIRWEPMNEPGCGGAIASLAVSPFGSRHLLVGGDMLGVGFSRDRGNTWQSTFGFRSWEIADFTWHPRDPNIVWVGTMSGPYVSHDGGRNWEERRQGFPPASDGMYSVPVEKVLFDPAAETRLLAFSGKGVITNETGTLIRNCLILGFDTAIYSGGRSGCGDRARGRIIIDHCRIDSNNGINAHTGADVIHIGTIHCWPFLTARPRASAEGKAMARPSAKVHPPRVPGVP